MLLRSRRLAVIAGWLAIGCGALLPSEEAPPLSQIPADASAGTEASSSLADAGPTTSDADANSGVGTDADADTADAKVPDGKLIFVTSTTFTAALGGVEGADKHCNDDARAFDVPGQFVAWLSAGDSNVIDRLSDPGPWVLQNGKLIAGDRLALTSNGPLSKITRRLNGFDYFGAVWTGTGADGKRVQTTDCTGFTVGVAGDTAVVGDTGQTSASWTNATSFSCNTTLSLICLQR